jgi:ADP-heptose:LPS heptosyltransferase/predicted SAM-dependent methyltransferase
MVWRADEPYSAESKKIVWEVAPYLRGKGLDLGCGTFKILPQAIGVDTGEDAGKYGWRSVADIRQDATKLNMFASQSMDFVYSSHLLEHVEDHKAALREWWRVLKHGGKLALYLPHKLFYPNIGEEGSNPDHKHDFMPQDIIDAMEEVATEAGQFDLVDCQERNNDDEYSMLLVFKKIQGKKAKFSYKDPKPTCKTVMVCRFGAFGDMMQATSVFAGLKKQGYHVSIMGSFPGLEVLSQDPHIDHIMVLERDQIPNADLVNFWRWQAKKYDKFVNLSESVEGSLLVMNGRTLHPWSPLARHKATNLNYVEIQHAIAGVPHDPQIKFYSTEDEKKWARKERAKMGQFVIMWSLAGSSVHKTWAGLDHIVASLMLHYPEVHVVFVGGPECMMLEAGWNNELRVHKTCGKWSIRQSLAFIAEANLIIGPETGVLNAAAMEEVPKIVFLSHSTEENLTRDWVHTTSLASLGTKCKGRGDDEAPACHILHQGWEFCSKDEKSGTAQCQVDISVEEVWYHVNCIMGIGIKLMMEKEYA